MKTLAVIKNELFKDYLRFVSTSDLPSVLDNPDIPVPFTCVESVDNQNSDLLLAQLKQYFNNSKVGNKDFYTLDSSTQSQLEFMFNLIKLSSGQSGSDTTAQATVAHNVTAVATPVVQAPVAAPVTKNALQFLPEQKVETTVEPVAPVVEAAPIVENVVTPQPVEQPAVVEAPVVEIPVVETPVVEQPTPVVEATVEPVVTPVINPAAQEEVSVFADSEQDDPFGFKTKEEPAKAEVAPVVENVVTSQPVVEEPAVVSAPQVAMIDSLGIPQGATIHFIKDASITATLVDEKTVNYDNQNMTLVEAAKAAFKKSGTVGMAVGLSNWNYAGETLKAWKEKQLN